MIKILTPTNSGIFILMIALTLVIVGQVFAQSASPLATSSGPSGSGSTISKTQQRLIRDEEYLATISQFDNLTSPKSKTVLEKYKHTLEVAVKEGKECRENMGSDRAKMSACDELIKANDKIAKKLHRILKLTQIEAKIPFVCVKADMGQSPALMAGFDMEDAVNIESPDQLKKITGKELPLFVCTGENGEKKLRVQDFRTGNMLKLDEISLGKFDVSNLPDLMVVTKLEKELGIN